MRRPPASNLALATLCVTVLISYGTLYYAFAVLAPRIAAESGWSLPAVTIGFSCGSVAGAIAGIPVGRLLQRHGPRWVMSGGSGLAGISIAAVALAPTYGAYVGAWTVAGLASAAVYYPPAFAALTQWCGEHRVHAITTLTLAAGFASTIFAPLTESLGTVLGWRGTYLVFAAALLFVTLPAHAVMLRAPWSPATPASGSPGCAVPGATARDRDILSSRAFIHTAGASTLTAFVVYASLVSLVPLLTNRGLSADVAALMLALGGIGQVSGRLLYPTLCLHVPVRTRMLTVTAVLAVSTAVFGVGSVSLGMLAAVALVHGAARGLVTLVGATVVTEYWGSARYASLNGALHSPVALAAAVAPALGAAIAERASYPALFMILGALGLTATAVVITTPPAPPRPSS